MTYILSVSANTTKEQNIQLQNDSDNVSLIQNIENSVSSVFDSLNLFEKSSQSIDDAQEIGHGI